MADRAEHEPLPDQCLLCVAVRRIRRATHYVSANVVPHTTDVGQVMTISVCCGHFKKMFELSGCPEEK